MMSVLVWVIIVLVLAGGLGLVLLWPAPVEPPTFPPMMTQMVSPMARMARLSQRAVPVAVEPLPGARARGVATADGIISGTGGRARLQPWARDPAGGDPGLDSVATCGAAATRDDAWDARAHARAAGRPAPAHMHRRRGG